ncbi:hypothetical protein [Acetobacter indonesiensis]
MLISFIPYADSWAMVWSARAYGSPNRVVTDSACLGASSPVFSQQAGAP